MNFDTCILLLFLNASVNSATIEAINSNGVFCFLQQNMLTSSCELVIRFVFNEHTTQDRMYCSL